MVMTPEAWTVIGTGVVVLIAVVASYHHLRGEMKALRDEFRGEMKASRDEFREETKASRNEMNQIRTEVGGLRERMAKLEGLLEGLREAITGRKAT